MLLLVTAFIPGATLAAGPPPTMRYQGVLRDAANHPLTGTFDMTFRFIDVQYTGYDILVDVHTGGGAVAVANGLFSVQLGGGTVTDGAGPGTYTSLGEVFRDHSYVDMQITVGTETLFPMVQIHASPYALNSGGLQGMPASSFLDTSPTSQTRSGPLVVAGTADHAIIGSNSYNGVMGTLGSTNLDAGVVGYGGGIGGGFRNSYGSEATTANYVEGIQAIGATTGGDFTNNTDVGAAILAAGRTGIAAYGRKSDPIPFTPPNGVGHFADNHTCAVDLAVGGRAVTAAGGGVAGRFTSSVGGYLAEVAAYDRGAGGYFEAPTSGVYTQLASDVGLRTNGTKAFLQNHPTDPGRLIAYRVLEGPEAGTYTRGSGSIRGWEARIALDPTFALTTDPDIGLTAVVTPRRARADLYVAAISPQELVVRSGAASAEGVAFDYVVNGLRVGFENKPVVLESGRLPSATVPTVEAAAARLAAMPEDVRASTPLARLSAERARSGAGPPEPAGARALIAGINSPEHAQHARKANEPGPPPAAGDTAAAQELPPGFPMPVAMEVQSGDVVSYDPAAAGSLRLTEEAGDPAVVGVVVGPPGARSRDRALIALVGTIVPCNVDASGRPIMVGDFLVASSTPGMAMSAGAEPRRGTVFGRALEPLPEGTGSIRVLVTFR